MTEYIKKEDAIDALTKQIADALRLVTGYYVRPQDVVERKRGKWIDGNGVDYVRCGCCHKNYDWISQAQYYNFCPNCGADMRCER